MRVEKPPIKCIFMLPASSIRPTFSLKDHIFCFTRESVIFAPSTLKAVQVVLDAMTRLPDDISPSEAKAFIPLSIKSSSILKPKQLTPAGFIHNLAGELQIAGSKYSGFTNLFPLNIRLENADWYEIHKNIFYSTPTVILWIKLRIEFQPSSAESEKALFREISNFVDKSTGSILGENLDEFKGVEPGRKKAFEISLPLEIFDLQAFEAYKPISRENSEYIINTESLQMWVDLQSAFPFHLKMK